MSDARRLSSHVDFLFLQRGTRCSVMWCKNLASCLSPSPPRPPPPAVLKRIVEPRCLIEHEQEEEEEVVVVEQEEQEWRGRGSLAITGLQGL